MTLTLCFKSVLFLFFCVTSLFSDEKSFEDGDIIFQTSKSNQSFAIMWATKSRYTHMGVLRQIKSKWYVYEARATVKYTKLQEWIKRGYFGYYAIKRYTLTNKEKRVLFQKAKKYQNRKYDIHFVFDKEKNYCSELVYYLYRDINKSVGNIQNIEKLDIKNLIVKKLIKKRWKSHPLCKELNEFQKCYQKILDQQIVTPEAIFDDKNLKTIYSNYPLYYN